MTASSPFPQSADAAVLPTGTVTFLFSDIEGSAQRWERYGEAMNDAVARHDAQLRAAMEAYGGRVFKTVGDAFCVAFARVSDAVAASIEAQRSLACEDFSAVDGLRIRCALHTGEAIERDGDYFGPAVNRIARLTSIGHGGQTLVSSPARELARTHLPPGTALVDLGPQHLQDLTEPEHVYQLNVAGLPAEFPPLRSLDALPNNLPIQPNAFVGREADLAEVKALIGRSSLLTLVGSGGVGKTRLALQAGADLLARYSDGVWFADLAPIVDAELVSSVIAQALGMSQQEGRPVDESIPPWLKRKKLLLILDNCEHVLETVAALASSIGRTSSDVHILATSRQPLDIRGEVVYRVSSLAYPPASARVDAAQALHYDAVVLFVDRAHAADTRFALTDDSAPIIAEICRRLDGIALAIELAAARVKVLSVRNLAQRLNERFKILTGGNRDALPRQKTLSALIDWSYGLLSRAEQLLFARLGIFARSFSLPAATAICSGDGVDEIEILDLLSSLTDKSLVVADTSGEQERYRLLESTAAYALEKLSAAGQRELLARRHAEYFRDRSLAAAADERWATGSALAWLASVELELDNYRLALEWALAQGSDAVLGGTIAGALGGLWANAGLAVEGRYWIELALERINESEQPRVAASLHLALCNFSSGKRKRDEAARAVQLYESIGDARAAARAQRQLAHALYQMGNRLDEARATIDRALATSREYGDQWYVANCLNQQAGIESDLGNVSGARNLYAQALAVFKTLGDELGTAIVLGNVAELEFSDGHPQEALGLANESLQIYLRGKNMTDVCTAYNNIAAYCIAMGDVTQARESARQGLSFGQKAQAELHIAIALQHLATLTAFGADARRAVRLTGYVDAQYRHLGMEREPTERSGYDKLTMRLLEMLEQDEIAALAAEGARWSEDRAVEEALKA